MLLPRILPVGAVALAVQPWRYRGRVQLTVIAKASFTLGEGGVLQPKEPEPIRTRDAHEADDPARSLADCTDLAPYLPRGEAVLTGSAVVPRGGRALARFAVANGQSVLFDRCVWVTPPATAEGDRAAVVRVPLAYEGAIGGARGDDNPVGSTAPMLTDARDPASPGAFGPVAPYWKPRVRHLAGDDRKGLKASVLELRDDFPWEYFHAAPPGQRAPAFFSGDEAILLENVACAGARVEARLPQVRATALVHDGSERPLPLVCDLLRVDADRGIVSVTFRGQMPFDEGARHRAIIAGRVEIHGEAPPWPSATEVLGAATEPKRGGYKTGTMRVADLAAPTMPFLESEGQRIENEPSKVTAIPGAFGAPAVPAPAVGSHTLGRTVLISEPPPASRAPSSPSSMPVPPPAPVPRPTAAPPTQAPSPVPAAPQPPPAVVRVPLSPAGARPPPPGLAAFGLFPFGARPPAAPEPAARPDPGLGAALIRTLVERALAARA